MWSTLKRIKFLHAIYNLLNYNKLRSQTSLYKLYGLNKYFYSSISSNDLPKDSLSDHPWLDKEDSFKVLPANPFFKTLSSVEQQALLNWSTDGYALIPQFYSEERVEAINTLFQKLMHEKKLTKKDSCKFLHAVKFSAEMYNLVNTEELTGIIALIMGREVDLYQSINFIKGSEDEAHSDFIHLSTYPYGYLVAVWIALEDITLDNGPLFYYPGSHKLPYMMNKDFSHGGNKWLIGKNYNKEYTFKILSIIKENKFEHKVFTASKGDVLIWHANMLHGGSKVNNSALSRKSMVLHYFGKDVIKYHERSERPSLLS